MNMSNANAVAAQVVSMDDEDMELINMVNSAAAARRKAEEQKQISVNREHGVQRATFQHRKNKLEIFLVAASKAAIGCVFLGAIVREMINPGFGVLLAVSCFLWAWFSYRKGIH